MFRILKPSHCLFFQIFALFNFATFANTQANNAANLSTLVSVVTYSRHGQRTPAENYEKDPFKDQWPVNKGQLLNSGKQLQFKLGQLLRQRYNGFLPEKYSETDIEVKASEQDRIMMSAGATLAGLYPPKNEQIWNEDLLWQPIPIYNLPEFYCYIILLTSCEKVSNLWDSYKQTNKYFHTKDTEALYTNLRENAGFSPKYDEVINVYYIWDTLHIQHQNNLSLPQWTKQIYPNKLNEFIFEMYKGFHYKDMIKMSMGGFFSKMMNHFNTFRNYNNSKGQLMKMYFAHDANINQILYAINNWNDHIIDYGATVIFELHKIKEDLFVKAYYLAKLDEIIPLEIEKGVINYPLEKLDKLLSKYYINNEDEWKKECKNYRALNKSSNFNITWINYFILVVTYLILFAK